VLAPVADREAELLLVREAPAVDLMDGHDVEAETSPDLGHRWVQCRRQRCRRQRRRRDHRWR